MVRDCFSLTLRNQSFLSFLTSSFMCTFSISTVVIDLYQVVHTYISSIIMYYRKPQMFSGSHATFHLLPRVLQSATDNFTSPDLDDLFRPLLSKILGWSNRFGTYLNINLGVLTLLRFPKSFHFQDGYNDPHIHQKCYYFSSTSQVIGNFDSFVAK